MTVRKRARSSRRLEQLADEVFMERALALAKKGAGRVSPNPLVGALIVRAGKVVGEGYHRKYGSAHAEVNALRAAGAKARGATLYVNLEPCNRHGHVPPCTDAILRAGIVRVVVGARDAYSKGRGGVERLKAAGVEVRPGVLSGECERINERFFTYTRLGRPFTVLKMAASLDGKVATSAGESKYITSEKARALVHEMRAESDAVLVGIGTVRADDPDLTVRLVSGRGRQPAPIVLDANLKIPLTAKLLRTKTPRKFVICSSRASDKKRRRLEQMGVSVIAVRSVRGRLDLKAAWEALGAQKVSSILVEGGPQVAWSVLGLGLADRLSVFFAPKLLGDGGAPGVFSGGGIVRLSDAVSLEDVEVRRVGPDLLVTGRPVRKKR